MDGNVVPVEEIDVKPNRELLSPPWLDQPPYQCVSAMTVWGFVPQATVEVEVDGAIADEFPFDQVTGALNPSLFGLTKGMVLTPKGQARGNHRLEAQPPRANSRSRADGVVASVACWTQALFLVHNDGRRQAPQVLKPLTRSSTWAWVRGVARTLRMASSGRPCIKDDLHPLNQEH